MERLDNFVASNPLSATLTTFATLIRVLLSIVNWLPKGAKALTLAKFVPVSIYVRLDTVSKTKSPLAGARLLLMFVLFPPNVANPRFLVPTGTPPSDPVPI